MIKVGIIGAGNMGSLHAKILKENKEVEIVGFTDLNIDRANEAAKNFGCKAFSSVDELLNSGLNMVFIVVPNTKHAELTIRALEMGIDVFCEKPMATSLEDAKAVIEAKEKSKKQVFIGLNRRFAPVYYNARKIVKETGFKPTNINIIQNDGDMINPPWLTDISLTGGFMYDTTVHFLDMARYLMGEIVEIRTLGMAACYPIMDDFAVQMKFEDGGFGVISTCGHASWISPFERVQVVGDHKSVITEELDTLRYSPGLGTIIDGQDYSKLEYIDKWGYRQMHEHIFDSLRNNVEPINGVVGGYKAVELMDACYKSAENDGEIIRF